MFEGSLGFTFLIFGFRFKIKNLVCSKFRVLERSAVQCLSQKVHNFVHGVQGLVQSSVGVWGVRGSGWARNFR